MIIAIDGPAGAGKSSVTNTIAEILGIMRLDTGAIYRVIALACSEAGVGVNDPQIGAFVERVDLKFTDGQIRLGDRDVSHLIRTDEVSQLASTYAAVPAVRQSLLDVQRRVAQQGDFVVDGRDIGTVVFPNAAVKIFLTASVDARARRRYLQYGGGEDSPTYEDVRASIIARDENDTGRKVAPLRKADDAIEVDSSNLSFDDTVALCLKVIRQRLSTTAE